MTAAAVGQDHVESTLCWCCGNAFEEAGLTRLGAHPDVGVCAVCARWLHGRARAPADEAKPTPGARLRRRLDTARAAAVIRAGLHHWPLLGRLLRRVDRHLP
jgi:hypothetical protein